MLTRGDDFQVRREASEAVQEVYRALDYPCPVENLAREAGGDRQVTGEPDAWRAREEKMNSHRSLAAVAVALSLLLGLACLPARSETGSGVRARLADAGASPSPMAVVQVREEIQKCYDLMGSRLSARNLSGYLEILTDDYVLHNRNGSTDTRKKLESELAGVLKAADRVDLAFKIESVTLAQDRAVVKQVLCFKAVIREEKSGVAHEVESQTTMLDTWKKTAEGWRLAISEEKASITRVDGKLQD